MLKSFIKEFILKVASNETSENKTLSIQCPIIKILNISSLSPGITYEVSIVYSFKSFGIECLLRTTCTSKGTLMCSHIYIIYVHIYTHYVLYAHIHDHNSILLLVVENQHLAQILGGTLAVIPVITIAFLVVVTVVIYKYRKWKKRSSSTGIL